MKIWTDRSSVFFSQSTRLTDRQTDRILIARPRLHSMQRRKKHQDIFETQCRTADNIATVTVTILCRAM